MVTLVLGAFAAMFQQDLKAVLAYSTISHLGLITMLVGLGSTLGVVAAIFHIVNHATFKASLFMAAGAVDHEAGTRDLRELGGLRRFMPNTTMLAVIARSEEHTSELQSLMRISYAVFCLKKKKKDTAEEQT